MFPLPFNIPFRKKDGTLSTLGDELNNGGGGGSYTLPTASAEIKGGVKVGEGLTMDGETLKNTNPTPYTLPTASDEVKGGVKVGSGLSIDETGVLSASGGGGGGSTIKTSQATPATTVSVESKSFKTFQVVDSEIVGKTIIGVSGITGGSNCKVLAIAQVSGDSWSVLAYNDGGASINVNKVNIYYVD